MSNHEYGIGAQLASWLRRSPVGEIKRCLRLAKDHDLAVSAGELEAHHLAGGRIGDLVEALVEAREQGMKLSFTRAATHDLAKGREMKVTDWVRDCRRKGLRDLDEAPL